MMKIERYVAQSMQEALLRVRGSLGADAVILSTRSLPPRWRWLGKKRVEVVAATDPEHKPAGAAKPAATVKTSPQVAVSPGEAAARSPWDADLRDIREALSRLMSALKGNGPGGIAAQLMDRGMGLELARELGNAARGMEGEEAWKAVRAAILSRVTVAGPIDLSAGKQVVALVGPTGVGKTTTVAKLAAHYALVEKKSVALVTLDTYRVGAVEQIRTYARILEVPLEVASSPEDVTRAMRRHRNKDLVLVDTVGHSQYDDMHLGQLSMLLKGAKPTQVHLVLAASTERQTMAAVAERFERFGPTRLIFTKLDEAQNYGALIERTLNSQWPVSYLAYGQEVPEALSIAKPEALAALLCPEAKA